MKLCQNPEHRAYRHNGGENQDLPHHWIHNKKLGDQEHHERLIDIAAEKNDPGFTREMFEAGKTDLLHRDTDKNESER